MGFVYEILSVAFTGLLVIVCVINNIRTGFKGKHGRSWLYFTIAIGLWFIAERIWEFNNLTETSSVFSLADPFWFVGYAFYFIFTMEYLTPFAKRISKKNIVLASVVCLTPLVLILTTIDTQQEPLAQFLYSFYPVADSVILIPSILGIILFFKGEVRLPWTILFFGILCFVISDYGYMYYDSNAQYYDGHYIDIPYIWAYAILMVGVLSNIKLWKRKNKDEPFDEQWSMK